MSHILKHALGQLLIVAFCVAAVSAAGPATSGFQKLQSLAGRWEGKDDEGKAVKTEFKLVAGGTAVLETLAASGMEEMLTVYSMDGESILLTHYCPTNNQPRMRAHPQTSQIRQLVFSFQDAGNLPNPAVGHEYKLVMNFDDHDHLTERWTWRRDGHDTDMVFRFARIGKKSRDWW
jgi:hypothetical protein